MLLAIILIIINILVTPTVVFAISPPIQASPNNNSQVASSKLTWETPTYSLYTNNPYRIQVDDNSDFSSVYRDYNTKNTYYTPVLTEGIWNWRVKAKDSNGTWSDWSNIWSFVLTTVAPSSVPTLTPTPTSTLSSTSPASSTTQSTSSFTISNIPSEINSDQSFSVTVNLSSLDKPNTKFYLKGAFRKPGSTNYFGLTKVSGNWIKNSSTYSDQNQVTTDSSGNWAGNLEIKPDIDDLGYTGSDDYSFKVGKYDSTDSNPSVSWSNEITIKIIDSGNTSAESSTPKPTAKNASSNPPSPTSTKSTTKSPQPKSYARLVYHSATVAGATASAASNPTVEIKSQKQTNPIIWVGLILVFTGTSMIGYIYFRKNAKIRKIRI